MKIVPSGLCSDAEFLRRVYLDLVGLPPTVAEIQAFLDDRRDTHEKRDAVIDRLIGSDDFIELWTNKWADLLQVNRKAGFGCTSEGAAALREGVPIRGEMAANMPYDQFVKTIITASGSNRENPPASYYKTLRTPPETMEATTHLFMAVRFNCNKCHDHPFERWTQDQYYQTAAYFARVDLKPDPASGKRMIDGTSVENAKPLFEIISDKKDGEVIHDRTKEDAPPKFPFAVDYPHNDKASRREELSAWLTSPNNPYFAKSYVNRLWGYLLGTGVIEPIDDIRAGNPPTNPALLDHLTRAFIDHKFDVRYMFRTICHSRTYQLSIATNRWNEDDKINYSHALARRLPAEVLYDTIERVAGSISTIPGVPAGTRACALPDVGVNLPDGFLSNLGRPARESVCECERSSGLQLGPVMALISGPTVEAAISNPANELTKLVANEKDDTKLINTIFMRVLNRPASSKEIETSVSLLRQLPIENKQLADRLQQTEKESAVTMAQLEQQRQAAIAKAKNEIAEYEKQIDPQVAAQKKERLDHIAAAEAALRETEKTLPARLAAWEKLVATKNIVWTPLKATKMSSTNKAKLTKEADQVIVARGPNGRTTYTIVANNPLANVTGFRLEAIANDGLPNRGPGRAINGNFVVSQFLVQRDDPKTRTKDPIPLQERPSRFQPGRVSCANGHRWLDRPWLGHQPDVRPDTYSRVRNARECRQGRRLNNSHQSELPGRPAQLGSVPHFGHEYAAPAYAGKSARKVCRNLGGF